MTQNPTSSAAVLLDTTGLICPEPIMLLHRAIRKLASGEQVRLVATDPSTQRDVPKFCTHLGHTLIEAERTETSGDEAFYFVIEKG
jgi:tRNA 2-thiouridine synthesizing protein A